MKKEQQRPMTTCAICRHFSWDLNGDLSRTAFSREHFMGWCSEVSGKQFASIPKNCGFYQRDISQLRHLEYDEVCFPTDFLEATLADCADEVSTATPRLMAAANSQADADGIRHQLLRAVAIRHFVRGYRCAEMEALGGREAPHPNKQREYGYIHLNAVAPEYYQLGINFFNNSKK